MYKIIVVRDYFFGEKASLGTCFVYNHENKQVFRAQSLERGWADNQKRISNIPAGKYPVILEHSNRFEKDLWEIKDVPNRCISLGNRRKDIDGDLVEDITSSRLTMEKFHKCLDGQVSAVLTIVDIEQLIK